MHRHRPVVIALQGEDDAFVRCAECGVLFTICGEPITAAQVAPCAFESLLEFEERADELPDLSFVLARRD